MPRTLAIGDIHGHLNALETLVDFVSLKNDDTLITLGDYVDRGPDSAGAIEWLIQKFDDGRLIPLRGNHDIMMLDALDGGDWNGGWQSFGGDMTLESYRRLGIDPEKDGLPEQHRLIVKRHVVVSVGVNEKVILGDMNLLTVRVKKPPDWLVYWEKWNDPPPHVSGKTMVCGHTAQKNGWPLTIGHAICIDTWVYGETGWLTCLNVDSGEVWQARESGETRMGWLDEEPDG